jgi:uncharacterized protein with von Willebrand factor type A (vWA) domain
VTDSSAARDEGPGEQVLSMVLRLGQALQAAGLPVAMVEVVDAVEAMAHLDLADRGQLRTGLRATFVKRLEDEGSFDLLFDRCFPVTRATAGVLRRSASAPDEMLTDGQPPTSASTTALRATDVGEPRAELLERLLAALRAGDGAALQALALEAVDTFAGKGLDGAGERSLLYRVLRALDLAALLSAAMRQERLEAGADPDELVLRLRRDELARRIDVLRRLLAAEIRGRRLTGPGATAAAVRRLEDLDVLQASFTDLRAMRQAVRPLARKLAAKVAQRRRFHRRGRLDMRRTLRRSLSSGGVPVETSFRHRRTSKPDVVVLCDLSGSMAGFAGFTLALVHALHTELSRLRTFVFVDGVAEVTDVLERSGGVPDAFHLLGRAGVVTGDGHSDYGQALERFWTAHGLAVIGPSTTVIVAGDARTNHRAAGLEPFHELCDRARRVYWLNPERRADWDTDDSAIASFGAICTKVFEVRTLRQLSDAVAEIM